MIRMVRASRVRLADHPEHGVAVAVRDLHIDQDDLERRLLELLGRLAAVVRQADAEPTLAEQVPEVAAEVAVVVDDQDQRLAERLVDQPEELGEVDRLGKHLPGPGGERLLGGGGAGIGGDQERDRRRRAAS